MILFLIVARVLKGMKVHIVPFLFSVAKKQYLRNNGGSLHWLLYISTSNIY